MTNCDQLAKLPRMYKSRRRPWVKLYCREWLTSTVRFDLTESDRSRFIDLLALAGDSKFPGIVAAGLDGDKKIVGYPLDWLASTMRCTVVELSESLKKFIKADRVKVEGPKDQPIIRISSWKAYQSEYLRQVSKFSGKSTSESSTQNIAPTSESSLHPLAPEVEVEVEREGESSPLPPASGGFVDLKFWGGTLRVQIGKKRRLMTDRDRAALAGARVEDARKHFEARGFVAEVLP